MIAPATVKWRMFHALGLNDARTRSVVRDMPRKSPVIMMMTISIGVRIACPVIIKATQRNNT